MVKPKNSQCIFAESFYRRSFKHSDRLDCAVLRLATADSQVHCSSSSLLITGTSSETKYAEQNPTSEVSDHGIVAASSQGLHEGRGPTFGDRSEIVHELVLRHSNDRILDRGGRICLIFSGSVEDSYPILSRGSEEFKMSSSGVCQHGNQKKNDRTGT